MSEYKLVKAEVENFKRVSLVSFKWDKDKQVLVLAGNNAQGKSSVIDGLWWALQGKGAGVQEPVKTGAKRAVVKLNLGDIIVTRTTSKTGTKLLVETKDGAIVRSPQTLLNEICGNLAFDPLAFCRMKQKEQKTLLQELVGLDFTDLEEKREELYAERTGIGRDMKRVKGAYESMEVPEGEIPDVEVSVSKLMRELQEVEKFNSHVNGLLASHEENKQDLEAYHRSLKDLESQKESLLKEIAILDERIKKGNAVIKEKQKEIKDFEASPMPEYKPVDDIKQQITDADGLNQRVRQKQNREAKRREVDDLKEKYDGYSAEIKAIDEEKETRLRAVKMPIVGLGLDDEGVLFNDIPLSQASSAEQMRVSLALAVAQNPELKLAWIKDGSLLDDNSMEDIARIAEEYGLQVIVERVGKQDKGALLIEDGRVVEGEE